MRPNAGAGAGDHNSTSPSFARAGGERGSYPHYPGSSHLNTTPAGETLISEGSTEAFRQRYSPRVQQRTHTHLSAYAQQYTPSTSSSTSRGGGALPPQQQQPQSQHSLASPLSFGSLERSPAGAVGGVAGNIVGAVGGGGTPHHHHSTQQQQHPAHSQRGGGALPAQYIRMSDTAGGESQYKGERLENPDSAQMRASAIGSTHSSHSTRSRGGAMEGMGAGGSSGFYPTQRQSGGPMQTPLSGGDVHTGVSAGT